MLVIYGGRNDNIFSMTNNVALNDICIFNLNKFTWETVALVGTSTFLQRLVLVLKKRRLL